MKAFYKFFRNKAFLPAFLIILGFFTTNSGYSQYCQPIHTESCTTGTDEYIIGVQFNTLNNESDDCGLDNGYSDYTYLSTTLYTGQSYNFTMYNGYAFKGDAAAVWIDFNNNNKLDDKGETFSLSSSDGNFTYTGKIDIPTSATLGSTRLRAQIVYSISPSACTKTDYGESEDYTVIIKNPPPDALVTSLTSPVKPFSVGTYPVKATLKNQGKTTMTSCQIDWSVNNVYQGTYNWTGTLSQNSTTIITLGNYNFDYPEGSNFNPFTVRCTTKLPNGENPDLDPSNDVYSVQIAPTLNDCGVVGVFGPQEGFGPGVTQVRARIKNYAPKPLSSVTVNWKVDGVSQTAATITGLNIKSQQEADVVIGTYNFYAKTPLAPFSIEATSSNPNGVADESQGNDKYTGGMGPSLVAGTYDVGGSNAHFPTIADAVSYLNSSGVFGQGTVTLSIRPGTYNGQILMNNPMPNNNPIIFKSSTNSRYDVTITASPTNINNYVMKFDNVSNVTLQDITVSNPNNNTSLAGKVIDVSNLSGFNMTHVDLKGVQNAPRKDMAYVGFTSNNCTGIVFSGTAFYNGSYAFYNNTTNGMSPSISINNCSFDDFTTLGVLNMVSAASQDRNVMISGNMFRHNGGTMPYGAIESRNSTTIANNTITGITGSGNPDDALIAVYHTSPDMNDVATITKNTIANCFDINGILASNAYAVISYNSIMINQSANYGYAAIKVMGSEGVAGDNMIALNSMKAFDVSSSGMFDILYNTVKVNNTVNPILNLNGVGMVERNIFQNTASAPVYQIGSANMIDQNVIYTMGNVAINGGANVNTLANWQSLGYDQNSYMASVMFANVDDLHIKTYIPELLFNTPLFNSGTVYQNAIENTDYDGETRTSYYAGSDEIFLKIILERQSAGIVDCLGSTTDVLSASAKINYDAIMTYQWDKDGVEIPGATKATLPFLNLQFKQRGKYRCKISGPGTTADVYTDYVSVYVLTPTEITEQPTDQATVLGNVAKFFFRAHVNGMEIEDAVLNDEVQVQWFKVGTGGSDVALNDKMSKIAGAKSNYLTINNFTKADEGSFYARITGKCGVDYTDTVALAEDNNDLVITTQPLNIEACSGTDGAAFDFVATTSGTKSIQYQWYKGGYPVFDNPPKVTGATTGKLTINTVDASDAGAYYAIAKLSGTSLQVRSADALLTIMNKPVITQNLSDVSVKSGTGLHLEITAEGNTATEVLTYAWYKDGTEIDGADQASYDIDQVGNTDAGAYWCTVSNSCGATESNHTNVAVTNEVLDVQTVSSNGYSLSSTVPNPVNGGAAINFYLPNTSNVKIILSDVNGIQLATLTDKMYPAGNAVLNINSYQLNLASGVYYYTLESGKVRLVRKMIVVK